MNQWYRKTVTKAVVLVIAVICGGILITSLLSAFTMAGTSDPAQIRETATQPYEESENFTRIVQNMMTEVLQQNSLENMFETDGTYNPDKLVDIMRYVKDQSISGFNESGIAYTLEELESWSEDYTAGEGDMYDSNNVIVCEKTDGNYYYYYLSEFLTLLGNGQIRMVFLEEEQNQEDFLRDLEEGLLTSSGYYDFRIYDSGGNMLYTDCWNFGQSLKEKFAPEGAENLLQVVNATPQLNGKLSIIYDNLATILSTICYDIQAYQSGWTYLEEGNTNFTYIYVNEDTRKVDTNKSGYENYADVEKNISEMISGDSVKYMIVYPQLRDFKTNMNISPSNEWDAVRSYNSGRRYNSIFAVAVDTTYPIQDQFYEGNQVYEENVPLLRWSLFMSQTAGVFFLIECVWLALTAGRRENDGELHLTTFDHWKTEIAAAVVAGAAVLGTMAFLIIAGAFGMDSISYDMASETVYLTEYSTTDMIMFNSSLNLVDITAVFIYGSFLTGCFFAGYISLIRRIKAKTLWENSLLRMIGNICSEVFQHRSVTGKTAVIMSALLIFQWMVLLTRNTMMAGILLILDAVVLYAVLNNAIAKNRLKKGIEEIASGNMSYQIPLHGLRGSNRALGEMINDIGSGLNKAVDEAMRNERLKTDLITNVSHDIKTPLTSIINYVNILKMSDIKDPKIQGYLDILEAKAQRLKTLTEDVVEASKVSSGNISLELMDVNLTEMIQQTEGEFAEKFTGRSLTMVVNLPEDPAVIHVDGRRMWRVLENIFGNAAKYAMPGTRVYADLSMTEKTVNFSLKNVSEQQLNISADELTERFIRGDISRSTEGSGLGLSIAKSLTIMQGGTFDLYLDGDLFRVNISFPRVCRKGCDAAEAGSDIDREEPGRDADREEPGEEAV